MQLYHNFNDESFLVQKYKNSFEYFVSFQDDELVVVRLMDEGRGVIVWILPSPMNPSF